MTLQPLISDEHRYRDALDALLGIVTKSTIVLVRFVTHSLPGTAFRDRLRRNEEANTSNITISRTAFDEKFPTYVTPFGADTLLVVETSIEL